ncbi:MAG TPA: hypothetical protein VIH88_12610 [Candidatus Acidoferrales bacterium]
MSQLADKIAAAVRPARSLTFNAVENVSSISPADVTLLRHLLEAELAARKIRVVQDPLPETLGDIKISEGVEGPLMTVEIHRSDDVDSREGIAIVALQKRAVTSSAEGGVPLILQRRFIFAQAEPILDFVSPDAPDGAGTRLLVLERDRVDYLRLDQARWSVDHSSAVKSRFHAVRDPRGLIAKDKNDDEAIQIYLPQETCIGSGHGQTDLGCSPSVRAKPPAVLFMGHMWPLNPAEPRIFSAPYDPDRNYFEGLEANFGDSAVRLPAFYSGAAMSEGHRDSWILAELDGKARLYDGSPSATAPFSSWGDNLVGVSADCDPSWLVLVSGTGDWTVRDTLRIYRVAEHQAATVGQPLEFAGPVLALWPAEDGKSARVVSRNLQTGMYEGSIVSVSCSN